MIAIAGVLGSEWTKLRSLRSTYLTMLIALVVAVAGGMFSAAGRANEWVTMTAAQRAEFDPVNLSFDGFAFAQLAFGVLGVLAISSEYATGTIRTTFVAVPRRRTVLAAKAAVVGALTLVLGELFAFAAFFLSQFMLSGKHLDVGLGDHNVLRAVSAAGVYLFALAMVGVGLGAVIRHSAGAISTVISLVFILPLLAAAVSQWTTIPEKWNLWAAGNALITTLPPTPDQPSAGLAVLICASYVVVTLGLASILLTRRDA